MNENWRNDSRQQRMDHINGYTAIVKDHLDQGWTGSILTLLFHPLGGGHEAVRHQMQQSAEQVYAAILKKMVRHISSNAILPVLIGCPDVPVRKHSKQSLTVIRPNDGLHWNGVFLAPPVSRMKTTLENFIVEKQDRFVRDTRPGVEGDPRNLLRVHSEPFVSADVAKVTDYVLKTVKQFRSSFDDICILPRSRRE